jgi:hypothetical protein
MLAKYHTLKRVEPDFPTYNNCVFGFGTDSETDSETHSEFTDAEEKLPPMHQPTFYEF